MPTDTKPALPFAPYEGAEPYIFVSYAHANKDKVYPIIARLHGMGYRLWYDEGIEGGDKWWSVIVRHIKASCIVLLFVTSDAGKSEWVEEEVLQARERKITIFPVYLEPVVELNLPIRRYQFIEQSTFVAEEDFYEKLCKGLPFATKNSKAKPKPEPILKIVPTAPKKPKPVRPTEPSPLLPSTIDYAWGLKDETVTINKYYGKEENVVIPGMIFGWPVVRLGVNAFADNTFIRSVTIPEGITVLLSSAFSHCSHLQQVHLPYSLQYIEGSAFCLCTSLERIIIPEGVSQIDQMTFAGCTALVDITVPNSLEHIHEKAFDSIMYSRNPNLTFRCPRGSYAERYAKQHKIKVNYTS